MSFRSVTKLLFAATLLAFTGQSISAAVVADNIITGSSTGTSMIGQTELMDLYPAIWSAGSFTTGPGSNWQLNSITLRVDDFYSFNPDQVGFSLQTNNSGNPSGVSLATLNTTTNIGFEANHDFTSLLPVILTPNTTYWVVGYPTNANALYTWMVNDAATDNGTLGWSIGDDLRYSLDLGSNWGTNPGAPMMKIDATAVVAVPEPSTIVLGGIAVLGLLVAARRRQ